MTTEQLIELMQQLTEQEVRCVAAWMAGYRPVDVLAALSSLHLTVPR